jgi:NMT1/THI5 like protein
MGLSAGFWNDWSSLTNVERLERFERSLTFMILRFLGLLLSATLTAPWSTLAAQAPGETIRVAIPGKLVDFSPFFVGLKTGIYRSEGLEPQFIVVRSGIVFPALLAGEFDYTTLYQSALRSAVSGLPVRVIATLITKQSFFLFSRPEIRRVQDLKGKRLAISNFASSTDSSAGRSQTLRVGTAARRDLARHGRHQRAFSGPGIRRGRRGDSDTALYSYGGAKRLEQSGLAR